ncbi:MAG: right-handed parallel beta-helix repeat-containing protein [Burkholderiales bacterium]|nr:right-handed parallel beta-helix repeat-containing protein [Burkholderiales bacterium]
MKNVIHHPAWLLLAAAASASCAANPTDNGSYGYKHIYVDNLASCKLPSTCGTQTNPYKNLREALSMVEPGSEVIVAGHAGTAYYNEDDGQPGATPFARQQFMQFPKLSKGGSAKATGSNQASTIVRAWKGTGMVRPVVRGTMKFGAWQSMAAQTGVSNLYALSWTVKGEGLGTPDAAHPGAYTFPVVGPQQLYRGGVALQQVGGFLYHKDSYDAETQYQWPARTATRLIGRIEPASGATPWLNLSDNQFYYAYDKAADVATLYVRLASPLAANETLEASVQQFLLQASNVNNLTVKDLVIERSNGSAYSSQNSAVMFNGNNIVVDGITVQDADAICVYLAGTKLTLKNSVLQRCGQMGLAASGSNQTVSNNTINYNNAKGFNEWWAGSGIKLIGNGALTSSTFDGNQVAYNYGHGIWLDTDPTMITIKNNIVAFNGDLGTGGIGVFIEISNSNTITSNQIFGNTNQGIQLKGTGNTVNSNLIAGNRATGIAQPDDARITASSGNTMKLNKFAWNDEVVNGSSNYRFAVQLAKGNTVNDNKYCGSGPFLSVGGVNAYDFATWRANGMDTSSLSSSKTVAYPYETNLTKPALLGNKMVGRSTQLIADAKSGALQTSIASYCGW